MRYLRGKLVNNRILIKVGIKPFQPFEPVNGVTSSFALNYQEFVALVDTGATRTCITNNVVHKLDLKRKGRANIWNIKRSEEHFTYLFDLAIWPETDGGSSVLFGLANEIEGIDVGNHPYFDVLIGMDIITLGSLSLDARGDFEMAFPG